MKLWPNCYGSVQFESQNSCDFTDFYRRSFLKFRIDVGINN